LSQDFKRRDEIASPGDDAPSNQPGTSRLARSAREAKERRERRKERKFLTTRRKKGAGAFVCFVRKTSDNLCVHLTPVLA